MAKTTAVRKTAPASPSVALAPQNAALQTLARNFHIELAAFPQGAELAAFNESAKAIVVIADQATHQQALNLLRTGKALKRGVDEHWMRVKRWLTERKNDVQAIMNDDLALADPHLARIGALCIAYEAAERRRQQEEAERARQEQIRLAEEKRARDQAASEKAALELESQSDDLSDRERTFVQHVFAGVQSTEAARRAGYKDPVAQGARLMALGKVTSAIDGMHQAKAIREQAAAVAEKPIEVAKVEVEGRMGHLAGSRTVTTWTGECFDYKAFVEAFQRGDVDLDTFLSLSQASETGGNAKARALKENLDRIPGWRHIKKETKAA